MGSARQTARAPRLRPRSPRGRHKPLELLPTHRRHLWISSQSAAATPVSLSSPCPSVQATTAAGAAADAPRSAARWSFVTSPDTPRVQAAPCSGYGGVRGDLGRDVKAELSAYGAEPSGMCSRAVRRAEPSHLRSGSDGARSLPLPLDGTGFHAAGIALGVAPAAGCSHRPYNFFP